MGAIMLELSDCVIVVTVPKHVVVTTQHNFEVGGNLLVENDYESVWYAKDTRIICESFCCDNNLFAYQSVRIVVVSY